MSLGAASLQYQSEAAKIASNPHDVTAQIQVREMARSAQCSRARMRASHPARAHPRQGARALLAMQQFVTGAWLRVASGGTVAP